MFGQTGRSFVYCSNGIFILMTENDDDLCEWRTDMNHGEVWSKFEEDTMAKHSAAKADDLSAIETAASGMNLFPVK